jgi:SNF2 family DNA or RNA helicase
MRKQALAFSREPTTTVAAWVKRLDRNELLETLNPVLDHGKTELELHQLASLLIGVEHSSWLFALDMGTGKTLIALYTFLARKLMGECKQMLVTAPPIVLKHWEKEVIKHTNLSVALVDGTPGEKFRTLLSDQSDIVVVSHRWLTRVFSDTLKGKLSYQEVTDACARFDMLVIDEAHTLSNPKSKGFEGYMEFLKDVPYRYELTGTPVGNSYTGVWALYYLLDRGDVYLERYPAFLRRWFSCFMVKARFPVYSLKRDRKQEFFDLFWTRAIRYEEGECNELPSKLYTVLPLTMSKAQQQAYDRLLLQDSVEDVEVIAADFMRITGGVYKDLKSKKTAKLEAIEYYVQEFIHTKNEQIIVWHWLVEEGRLIVKFLKSKFPKLRIGEARGEVSKTNIEKNLLKWRKGKIDILVANVASIGIGIDLYESRVAIYYSNSFSVIHRNHSEKRIHRTGQKRSCIYIDLVCEGTIDDHILGSLRKAKNAFAGFTGDAVRSDLRRLWRKKRSKN